MWKILKKMGIPYHLTYLLKNLYAGQEATVRTRHGTRTGSKLGKEYTKAVYCHPDYLTYMQSTSYKAPSWIETQAGIKIPGRNISTLRYADDTTLMAESEEELKSLSMKAIEASEKASLKLNVQRN